MAAALENTVETDSLSCSLCVESYKDPRSLTCLHTFCLNCMIDYIKSLRKRGKLATGIECPICRHVHKLNDPRATSVIIANKLPKNFALVHALDKLSKKAMTVNENTCQLCLAVNENREATMYCLKCDKDLCSTCVIKHNTLQKENHNIIKIAEKSEHITYIHSIGICKTHDQEFDFFCKEHCTFLCVKCAVTQCKECNKVDIEMTPKDSEINDTSITTPLHKLHKELTVVLQHCDQSENDIDMQIQNIEEDLQKRKDAINKAMTEFQIKIMESATQLKENKSHEISVQRKWCRQNLLNVERAICKFRTVMLFGTEKQKNISRYTFLSDISELSAESNKQISDVTRLELKFDEKVQCNRVTQTIATFGDIKAEKQKLDITLQPDIRARKFRRRVSKNMKGYIAPMENPLISDISFLSDGRIIAVDNKNDSLIVLDNALNVLCAPKLPSKPLGIYAVSPEQIYITTSYQINAACLNGNVFEVTNTTKTTSKLFSISPIDESSFAVGCYNTTKPVKIVSKDGTQSEEPIYVPDKSYHIDDCRCATVADGEKIAFSDKTGGAIYIYDIKEKSVTIVKDKALFEPREITACDKDSFLVGADKIVVHIDVNGYVIGSNNLGNGSILSMAYSQSHKRLVVFDTDLNMHIFEVTKAV